MELSRLQLTPRSPRILYLEEEDDNDGFMEILKRLGVPTYYSKSQFSLAEGSVFDRKIHELIDQKDGLTRPEKLRKRWLKVIRNYTRLNNIRPLLRHFYDVQIPIRYRIYMERRSFQRWRTRQRWLVLSAIINRLNLRRAANDDKERISQRRVLLSSKFLASQPEYQPNYHYFILNAIPNPTTCTVKINQEDEEADREEYRKANEEYLRHLEEEAEEERRRKRRRRKKPSPRNEQPPEFPDDVNEEQEREVDINVDDVGVKDTGVDPQDNISVGSSASEKRRKRKQLKKQEEKRKKQLYMLVGSIAFILGFILPLGYYIHSGDITDTKSFFFLLKTSMFGLNATEKCMLDPECRRKTEQMLLEKQEAERLAREIAQKAEDQEKNFTEKERLQKERRKQKKEERLKQEEIRRAQEEKALKKLKMLALSKDPETRDDWIKQELQKLTMNLKTIEDTQESLNEKLTNIQNAAR